MAKRYGLSLFLLSLCFALCASPAWGAWVRNGVLVSAENGLVCCPKIAWGGDTLGTVIAWQDYSSGYEDLWGNRIGLKGNVFGGSGVPVCLADYSQWDQQIIPDGTGGAIVAWMDQRAQDGYTGHVYAQRVDGTGTARWGQDGLPICLATYGELGVRIVPDGAGGAIIVWADQRMGQWDIYAQRVTADGDTLWQANGAPVDTAQGDQTYPEVISDGAGGAIIVWLDTRNGFWEIYGQRIDGDCDLLWGPDPVQISEPQGNLWYPYPVLTSDGGVCVAWQDYRTGWANVFVQKLDLSGNVLWQSGGVSACAYVTANEYVPRIASDGAGGVIACWRDERRGYQTTFAQRMDADGNLAWDPNAVEVFSMWGDCDPAIVDDGVGGAFIALDVYWEASSQPNDIYVQRVDHDGNLLWGPKGVAVCDAVGNQYCPALIKDGSGGVIVSWEDYRGAGGIYCQRVGPSGLWGDPEPAIVSCLDVPEDQGGWVRVVTKASSHDSPAADDTPIFGYNVWRLIEGGGKLLAAGPTASGAWADATTANRTDLAAVSAEMTTSDDFTKLVSLLRDPATASGVRVGGPLAAALGLPPGDWESVGYWIATQDTAYAAIAPTKNDSTEAGMPWETFIVTAHTMQAGMFVASAPATGYSVDNLAPPPVTGLAGTETASPHGLALTWTASSAPDIWRYDIHRGDDALFVPDGTNLLGTTSGTGFHDSGWFKAFEYFYKLVAVDRHGNRGVAALLRPEDVKVGTMLESYAASLEGSGIEVTWRLAEVDDGVSFAVLRSADGGEFAALASPEIVRDGLSFTMRDRSVEPGTTYRYRVAVAEVSGGRMLFETGAISTPVIPLTLYQNHPNPFNPATMIGYYLPAASVVRLEVYDSSGRLISRVVDGVMQERGTHEAAWLGCDGAGRRVSSGVYFYRLTSGKETISKKMVLLR